MVFLRRAVLAAALAAIGFAGTTAGVSARDWVATGWKKVPVREYASAAAPVVGTVVGGDYLKLTGFCTRELDLDQISYMKATRQRAIVATRWCEVTSPAHGWVFGGFMKPW